MAGFTQKAIRQTFLLLLETTPLDKITVKMIVDACGISRNTFYYHYEDIPALLRDVLETELTSLTAEPAVQRTPYQRALNFLTYIAEHRPGLDRVYRSGYRAQLNADLRNATIRVAAASVDAAGGSALDADTKYTIAAFFASGLLSLCSQWLENGAKEPPEALLQRLRPFDGLLEAAVERAKQL